MSRCSRSTIHRATPSVRRCERRSETLLAELGADLSVRAVVVTGRGKAFCSGDDLREEFEAVAGGGERGANLLDFGRLLDQLESFRAPVIAAVNGWCVGGGVELALCCDVRLASSEAKFVCAGVNVGLMASAYRLPRLIGVAQAKEMLFTGRAVRGRARRALRTRHRRAHAGAADAGSNGDRRPHRLASPALGRGEQARREQGS